MSDTDHILILDDDPTSQRMVLVWHMIRPGLRTGLRSDLCDAWASFALCPTSEVSKREPSLTGLGIVLPDGSISGVARVYLDRIASSKLSELGSVSEIAKAWMRKQPADILRNWLLQHMPEVFE